MALLTAESVLTDPDHLRTVEEAEIVELFAGPGGTSEGMRMLGLGDGVGIEWDENACRTADAAGHVRLHADLTKVGVGIFRRARGLWGSPSCQAYSNAGKKLGRLDLERIYAHLDYVTDMGRWIDYPALDAVDEDGQRIWHDPRSPMILEVVRFIMQMRPEWIACEQVPAVLPFWEKLATLLVSMGYSAWAGLLRAEQYGVAQTRKRAIIMARRIDVYGDEQVTPPPPTHRQFRAARRTKDGLVPARLTEEDLALPKWVSMAEALGWALVDPAATAMRSSSQANATIRSADQPSPTITGGHDRAERTWIDSPGAPLLARDSGPGAERTPRSADDPSYTVRANGSGSHPSGVRWMVPEEQVDEAAGAASVTDWVQRSNYGTSGRADVRGERAIDEPSASVTGKIGRFMWAEREQRDGLGEPIDGGEQEGAVREVGEGWTVSTGANSMVTSREGRKAGDGGVQPYERPITAPAPTVDAKTGSAWQIGPAGHRAVRFGNQANSAVRDIDEPAATIRFSERMNACDWIAGPDAAEPAQGGSQPAAGVAQVERLRTGSDTKLISSQSVAGVGRAERSGNEPAVTVTQNFDRARWADADQPSTTVQGDPRIAPRGHHDQQMLGAIRVSVQEAAVLQSFRPDYPWHGGKSAQYQQIGNAVPPLLAVAVLGHLLGIPGWRDICQRTYRPIGLEQLVGAGLDAEAVA